MYESIGIYLIYPNFWSIKIFLHHVSYYFFLNFQVNLSLELELQSHMVLLLGLFCKLILLKFLDNFLSQY